MNRFEDWPVRLNAAILEKSAEPFAWGLHDCCRSVCDCIREMTGVEVGPMLQDYDTARGAALILQRFGGVRGLAVEIVNGAGLQEIGPAFAAAGDMVLTHDIHAAPVEGETLGIVALNGRFALLAGRVGWIDYPVRSAAAAWRV